MKRVYSEEQKEKRRKAKREWYRRNQEKVSLYNKEYYKKYREENYDELLRKKRLFYSVQENIDHKNEYNKDYYSTKIGRASNLSTAYKQEDEKHNRGECTITKEWIVDNIFSGQKCVYCGETDWHKLGCDRIDNSLPHTPENVVCCCGECNVKKGKTKSFDEYIKMLGK